MGSQKRSGSVPSSASLSLRTGNKLRRKELYVQQKKDKDKTRREERYRRKREERDDPELRRKRLARNQPLTIEKKRVWDEDGDEDSLWSSMDVAQAKKRRIQLEEEAGEAAQLTAVDESDQGDDDGDEVDSMLGTSDDDGEDEEEEGVSANKSTAERSQRDDSLAPSTTSTNLDLTPTALALKFPTLFTDGPMPDPKILVTTSLQSTIHHEARLLCDIFPNSTYVPRSAHRYGHKYSVREISKFAANRGYTSVVVLHEDLKRPSALTIVHLPSGPTFTFSLSSWVETKKLPGHGVTTGHYPELLLNNFKTALGLLTARLFYTLFPPQPELVGRNVLTLHNSRDYLFLRVHRYAFREKRATEKNVVGSDGKEMAGVEGLRAGLQEIGPVRFTMKLRRIDKGIGRAGSEGEDALQWEWKAKMEKKRTRFNL